MKLQRDKKNIKKKEKKKKRKKKKQGVNLRKMNISKVIRTKREYCKYICKVIQTKKEKKKKNICKMF